MSRIRGPAGNRILTNSRIESRLKNASRLLPEDAVAIPTILDVMLATGFANIYDFDPAAPTDDQGDTAADLSEIGTWTNGVSPVQGCAGFYENVTNLSAANRLESAGTAIVNRTGANRSVWVGVYQLPTTPVGAGDHFLAQVGTFASATAHSALVYDATAGNVQVLDQSLTLRVDLPGLTAAYLLDPTIIFVEWDGPGGNKLQAYYRKVGQPETLVVGAGLVGSGGFSVIRLSGDGTRLTCKHKCHAWGFEHLAAALSAALRDEFYAAMGII